MHLHLSVMSPHELQLGVQDNRLDLAIGAFSTRMSGLVYMPLYREQHWLYCSNRHPLYSERRIPEQVITQQRMVGRGYWSQAELARHGFKHSAATVESMEAQLILVLSGATSATCRNITPRPGRTRATCGCCCRQPLATRRRSP